MKELIAHLRASGVLKSTNRVIYFCKSAKMGVPEAGGFDRIIAAAEVAEVPHA